MPLRMASGVAIVAIHAHNGGDHLRLRIGAAVHLPLRSDAT
ncbi:MAG: hypothetical protein R2911_22215 [Caldilineaceae bacterium]